MQSRYLVFRRILEETFYSWKLSCVIIVLVSKSVLVLVIILLAVSDFF